MEKLNEIPPRKEISSGEAAIEPSSVQSARERSISPQPGVDKEHQVRCYQWLVEEGGKPLCTLQTLDKIYEDPEPHMEMLRPWIGDASASSLIYLGVFSRQLERWRDFRRWQRSNRGLRILCKEGFASFLDEKRRFMESQGLSSITERPDFEATMQRMWSGELEVCEEQWSGQREVRDGTFAEYVKAAQARLARHGFTQKFDLREDAEGQDDRATWIEYLEFECWTLDRLTASVQRKERQLGDDGARGFAYQRSKRRESNQQLRVQWILSMMPADPKAAQFAAAERGTVAKAPPPRAAQKRKRSDEDESMGRATDKATDEEVKPPNKKRMMRKQGTKTATCEETSRMTRGLDTPVSTTRVQDGEGGSRRSARIKKLDETKTVKAVRGRGTSTGGQRRLGALCLYGTGSRRVFPTQRVTW